MSGDAGDGARATGGAWVPARGTLIAMVVAILLAGVANLALGSGLSGEPIAYHDHGDLDVAALDELEARGVDPCPTVGPPVVPPDLADRLRVECEAYDTSSGLAAATLAMAVLGAVMVAASGNRFGLYLMLVAMVLTIGFGVLGTYAVRGLALRPGSLPGAEVAAFIGTPSFTVLTVLLIPRMILIFPTGTLPAPRWRWVVRATWIPAVVLTVSSWLAPLWLEDIRNPLPYQWSPRLAFGVFDIGILVWVGLVTASFAGLLWRFGTARGDERQQLKWVAYAAALALVVNVTALFVPAMSGTAQQIANFVILPGAALISIFKFRLYDIDRIINRTVVYGLVTLVVVGVFAVLVVVPQNVFLDGGSSPNWVIALATLVAAAIFNPLRGRVQHAVDRRFNRAYFDAREGLDTLQDQLRRSGDLETLGDLVHAFVEQALGPRRIALWWTADGEPEA
ncbi:MAG: hypothetical protein R3246_13245 [Acidimicrobiia bacterium]|nr:hypothetical protein [Acidimicrobiia bacterium]